MKYFNQKTKEILDLNYCKENKIDIITLYVEIQQASEYDEKFVGIQRTSSKKSALLPKDFVCCISTYTVFQLI